ncbi:MAG TPA: LysR substrate-binding domain-containing protein [Rectinemataceae bacterium]|nr:LysR substrate-binding domain-containing protein [Rectinemataceae bacterium]
MELRHFRYFLAVADHLSFIKAAERLHISQPPLSRQIRELEREIGTPLFYRGKHIRLTKAGLHLQDQARRILDLTGAACRDARLLGEERASKVNIGCVSFVLSTVLLPLFELIRDRIPGLTLELRVMSTEAQVQALKSGTIDIGFVRSWVRVEDFAFEPLVLERLYLIYPSGFESAGGTALPLSALAEQPFVGISQAAAPGLAERIEGICLQTGFTPSVAYECNDAHAIERLVAAGLGWSIVPDLALERDAPAGVRSIQLPETITLGICYRNESHPETIDEILKLARSHFAGLEDPAVISAQAAAP